MGRFIVADIGGTSLRIARYDTADRQVHDVLRTPVEGLDRYPAEPAERLQARVVEQLVETLGSYLRTPAGAGAAAVGLSFAGPIDERGFVTAAPTIWGAGGAPLPVGDILEQCLGEPVLISNDLTAAAWRYADTDAADTPPFCVLTVSSGIGNKVFRRGEVLLDPDGHGGELGHWRVDLAPDAPLCDCGGRGHLGALASGRGMLAAARRAATSRPREFADSALAELTGGRPADITNAAVVAALRADDPFVTGVLRGALRHLALAVSCVFTAIGVRRFIIIGGFALAVGDRFVDRLADELLSLGCFGLTEEQVRDLVRLGSPDDDHSLIGVGRLVSDRFPDAPSPAARTLLDRSR